VPLIATRVRAATIDRQTLNAIPSINGTNPAAGKVFLSDRWAFWYKWAASRRHLWGQRMGRAVDYIIQNIFEPSLNWALSHPILSVVAVAALIYFSVRNYRMLW